MVYILIAIISIQGGAALAKELFPVVGAAGATAQRLIASSLMLLIFFRPWRNRLSRAELLNIAIYGGSLGAMNLLFYYSLRTLPLGIAVALEFTGPLSVALLSSRRPIDFVWAFLAAVGIFLILPISPFSVALDPVGVLFALGAGAAWAFYIVFGKRTGNTVHGGTAVSLGVLMAAIVAVPFGLVEAGWKVFDPKLLPIALAVGFFSSALPYTFEMMALKRTPQKTFGILMSLEPAVAAICGMLLLGEHLSALQWAAMSCIIAASFGSAKTQ